MLAYEAQYLDYALSHDFFDMNPVYNQSFPRELAHFLDSDVQPEITRLHDLRFLIPSPTPP